MDNSAQTKSIDHERSPRRTRIVFAQVIALETLIILALWFLGRMFS
jgi:hypothetical protein